MRKDGDVIALHMGNSHGYKSRALHTYIEYAKKHPVLYFDLQFFTTFHVMFQRSTIKHACFAIL